MNKSPQPPSSLSQWPNCGSSGDRTGNCSASFVASGLLILGFFSGLAIGAAIIGGV